MDPKNLQYMETHEWVHIEDGVATIGISKFALDQLSDLVHLELPGTGDAANAGSMICEIESVKSVSDIYSPVNGEVVEVNEGLTDDLDSIGQDPYGNGWMVKVKMSNDDTSALLSFEDYEKQCAEADH